MIIFSCQITFRGVCWDTHVPMFEKLLKDKIYSLQPDAAQYKGNGAVEGFCACILRMDM